MTDNINDAINEHIERLSNYIVDEVNKIKEDKLTVIVSVGLHAILNGVKSQKRPLVIKKAILLDVIKHILDYSDYNVSNDDLLNNFGVINNECH